MEPAEFVDPRPGTRRILTALYGGAVLVGALLVVVLRPALWAFIKGLPVCEQGRWSVVVLALAFGPLPLAALWSAVHARRLLKFNQSPLPRARVWRRTPVRRGRPVRIQAYALLATAAVLLLAPIWTWFRLQLLLEALLQRCGA